MEQEIQLPYGAGTLKAHLPEACLSGVYLPRPVDSCPEPLVAIERALANPMNTPRLSEIVRPGEKVVILIDDHTRVTPAALILPPLLKAMRQSGVSDEDIMILITHGTHRLSSDEEVRGKVGDEVYGRLRIEQHRCDDERNQVYVGMTSRGTPVWINRLVVEADRRIGIGHVGPSPYAGYSGGLKLLVPGVAALDTINANHSLVPLGFRRSADVTMPCRLDIEEAANLVGLDLVVDVVLCQDGQIAQVFAGTPERVHQEGLALARKVHEVPSPGGVDVAITAGYPYDLDLYQAVRAVEYADLVVREGGSILLVAACPDGIGGEEFYRLMADRRKKPEGFLRDIVRRNGKVTFSVLGYALARIKAEKRLYIFTDGISNMELEAMGFHPLTSFQAGVDTLLSQYGLQAQVIVFPMGSSTIPVIARKG
jgi:nickel-dependent lactate racemase